MTDLVKLVDRFVDHLSGRNSTMNFKIFLTLTLGGTLLAGGMLGTFVEGTDEPVRQGLLLGFGVWLVIVGVALLHESGGSRDL